MPKYLFAALAVVVLTGQGCSQSVEIKTDVDSSADVMMEDKMEKKDDGAMMGEDKMEDEGVMEKEDDGAAMEVKTDVDVEVGAGVEVMAPKTVTISYDGSSFSPAAVSIKKGDTVTFRNDSSTKVWPASDVHPTHGAYPEKGEGCLGSNFDACKGLSEGETYSFRFNQVGSWRFHNHLRASQGGTVNVSE